MEPPNMRAPAPGEIPPAGISDSHEKNGGKKAGKVDIPPPTQNTDYLKQMARQALQNIKDLKKDPDFIKMEQTNPIITTNIKNINQEYADAQKRYLEAVRDQASDDTTKPLEERLDKLEQEMYKMISQMKKTASAEKRPPKS